MQLLPLRRGEGRFLVLHPNPSLCRAGGPGYHSAAFACPALLFSPQAWVLHHHLHGHHRPCTVPRAVLGPAGSLSWERAFPPLSTSLPRAWAGTSLALCPTLEPPLPAPQPRPARKQELNKSWAELWRSSPARTQAPGAGGLRRGPHSTTAPRLSLMLVMPTCARPCSSAIPH